jgi:hypothetical protein
VAGCRRILEPRTQVRPRPRGPESAAASTADVRSLTEPQKKKSPTGDSKPQSTVPIPVQPLLQQAKSQTPQKSSAGNSKSRHPRCPPKGRVDLPPVLAESLFVQEEAALNITKCWKQTEKRKRSPTMSTRNDSVTSMDYSGDDKEER